MARFSFLSRLGLGLFFGLWLSSASAENFGLGLMIGSPTGLTAKGYLSPTRAIDGTLAWSTGHRDRLYFHSTYLIHKPDALRIKTESFTFFYGVGLLAEFRDWNDEHRLKHQHEENDELSIGPRFPAGLLYSFKDPAIEVFTEVSLALELIPDTDVHVGIGLGGRYFF